MMRRVWTLYSVEVTKALRLKLTYLGPALVVLTVVCLSFVTPIRTDGVSDYGFIARATPIALNLVGLFMILTWCAALVSSEFATGTARLVLVRPLRRLEFAAAKILAGVTYAVAVAGLVSVSAWLLTFVRGDLLGVTYGGELVHTAGDMVVAYFLGFLVALFPLTATVTFAVMLSTLSRNTGAAIGSAIGLWVAADVVKYPLRVAPYLFSSYIEQPWQVFTSYSDALDASWFPMVVPCIAVSLAWTALFTTVSFYSINRRNLNA